MFLTPIWLWNIRICTCCTTSCAFNCDCISDCQLLGWSLYLIPCSTLHQTSTTILHWKKRCSFDSAPSLHNIQRIILHPYSLHLCALDLKKFCHSGIIVFFSILSNQTLQQEHFYNFSLEDAVGTWGKYFSNKMI